MSVVLHGSAWCPRCQQLVHVAHINERQAGGWQRTEICRRCGATLSVQFLPDAIAQPKRPEN